MPNNNCSNCTNLAGCTAYCQRRAGKNIDDFMKRIDFIETDIGDMHKDQSLGNLTVFGVQVDGEGLSVTSMLTSNSDVKVSLDEKIGSFAGDSPYALIKLYYQYSGADSKECNDAVSNLRKFNSVHIVPVTFKPGTEVECKHPGFDRRGHKSATTIKAVKVSLDKDTGELVGIFLAPAQNTENGSSYIKMKLSDYGTEWTIPGLEKSLRASDIDRRLIKVDNIGLIKPIEVYCGDYLVAIDGQYMYLRKPEATYIVGHWGYSGLQLDDVAGHQLTESKACQYIVEHAKFIEKHRRFIVPYGFTKPNHIDL